MQALPSQDNDVLQESQLRFPTPLCYRATTSSSSGIFLGENPLDYSFPLLLSQITIIYLTTRITHAALRPLGQPQAISQIVGGIILGPTFLSRSRSFKRIMYTVRTWEQVNALSLLAFMLFIFMIGVKTDLGMIRKSGKKASVIAIVSTVAPFMSVFVAGLFVRDKLRDMYGGYYLVLLVGAKWNLTSYAVLSCVLAELNLLTSQLGRLAMSASLIANFFNQIVSIIVTAVFLARDASNPGVGLESFVTFLAFIIFMVFVARPIVLWMIKRTPEGDLLDEFYFVAVLGLAIFSGFISEIIGYQATTGPFILGLILPGGPPLGVTLVERLDRLINGVFLPLFLATAGFKMDLAYISDIGKWWIVELFLAVAVISKFLSSMLICLYCKMPMRDSICVGLMMICKGIFEVDVANQWRGTKFITRELYTMVVFTIVVVGGGSALLLRRLYRPEDRFIAYKRRTIEHFRHGDEFRVLACTHSQDNVWPLIALTESINPTPEYSLCLYVLHLVQLVGRSATILAPYKQSKSGSASTGGVSDSHHIFNAFRQISEQYAGCLSILPYVCISPYATMHEDICALALDKKVTLVVLHFHKHAAAVGQGNPSIRSMNINVLRYAPCSVAILIDNGLSSSGSQRSGVSQRVAVYFFGGPDDREALACGGKLAMNPDVAVTLVRFRSHQDWNMDSESKKEEKLDDDYINEWSNMYADGRRVVCREEIVKDGEATVAVIRSMSKEYTLLIVGRREGKESQLTEGLSAWSEYPELGVIGDMLTSTDFGGRVSTLVVQQQTKLARGGGGSPESPRGTNMNHSYTNKIVPQSDD